MHDEQSKGLPFCKSFYNHKEKFIKNELIEEKGQKLKCLPE